ncbi:hypothetical protein RvY_10692 [Ramazzottius varieornatus]|uniref:Uncharacterized protein n=1 Tax=Ramazzottius varieornatus TaxID=947166 RepID=A0A1D1VDM3_RAMVA|nr:hypothetical protein RvY_10692 [Ramazzottius varieornatus]
MGFPNSPAARSFLGADFAYASRSLGGKTVKARRRCRLVNPFHQSSSRKVEVCGKAEVATTHALALADLLISSVSLDPHLLDTCGRRPLHSRASRGSNGTSTLRSHFWCSLWAFPASCS